MRCLLCYDEFKKGDQVYVFPRHGGGTNEYHMECFADTSQGRAGYMPRKVFYFGIEEPQTSEFIKNRFLTVQ